MTAGDTASLSGRPDVLDGPFTTTQLLRLDEALRLADESTGLTFSVYVGDLDEPSRPRPQRVMTSHGDAQEASVTQAKGDKVGRNAPCPCGSGRKYKKCHGATA